MYNSYFKQNILNSHKSDILGTVKQLILKAFNQAEFVKIAELPGASPPGPAGALTAPPRPPGCYSVFTR